MKFWLLMVVAVLLGWSATLKAEGVCSVNDADIQEMQLVLGRGDSVGNISNRDIQICNLLMTTDFTVTPEAFFKADESVQEILIYALTHHDDVFNVKDFDPMIECYAPSGAYIGQENPSCNAWITNE